MIIEHVHGKDNIPVYSDRVNYQVCSDWIPVPARSANNQHQPKDDAKSDEGGSLCTSAKAMHHLIHGGAVRKSSWDDISYWVMDTGMVYAKFKDGTQSRVSASTVVENTAYDDWITLPYDNPKS